MGFKLYSDSMTDMPMLACDVCGERIIDIWNDKATGSPGRDGQTTDVVVHHATHDVPGTVSMLLVDFIRLFVVQNRPGNLGSDGVNNTVHVQYPMARRFDA